MRQKVSILKGVFRECRPTSGRARCRADLRHIARADDAVAVAARVWVVAELPWLLARRVLRERGVDARVGDARLDRLDRCGKRGGGGEDEGAGEEAGGGDDRASAIAGR